MSTEPLQLLTVIDAAEQLRSSRSKIYELIAEGELPSIRIGHSRRIAMADLADFVARHAENGTAPPALHGECDVDAFTCVLRSMERSFP